MLRYLKTKIKKVYYWGNKFYCPVCNSNLRDFLFCGIDVEVISEKQIIGAGRRKALCPVCGSVERDRLIYIYVKDYLLLFNQDKKINILHIAPEYGLYQDFYKNINHKNYICGDKFDGYFYDKNVRYMDITQIDWQDNYFDLIICNHVLEHIPDDKKAMKELYRVLKPGGRAILQVPISYKSEETFEDFMILEDWEKEKFFGQRNHCRIYGKDYGARLEEAGFKFSSIKISDKKYAKCGLDQRECVLTVTR